MSVGHEAMLATPAFRAPTALPTTLAPSHHPLIAGDDVWIYCGWQRPNSWMEHHQATVMIVCVLAGGECRATTRPPNGRTVHHRIPIGHVWIVPAGLLREMRWLEPVELLVLYVESQRGRDFCGHPVIDPSVARLGHYAQKEAAIGSLCESLRDHNRTGQSDEHCHIGVAGTALASFIVRAHFAPQRQWKQNGLRLREADLQRVELHIEENLSTPFSLAVLARVACLSPAYFCRVFKATTGYKPREYFNRRRMWRAKERIETGEHTISEVAYDLAIYDLGHFGRLFRKFFNTPPRAFLPRQKKTTASKRIAIGAELDRTDSGKVGA